MAKLTKTQLTEAVARYARRHNCYASTVRAMTVLLREAIAEYKAAKNIS